MSLSTSPWRTKNWLFFVNVIALHRQVSLPLSLLSRHLPNSPILGLNLARIPQHPNIDKQLARRHQAARKIDVRPPALIRRHKVGIRARKLLLTGTQIAAGRRGRTSALRSGARPALQRVAARPHGLLDAARPHAVVRQQAALVAPHRQVRDQQRARRIWGGGGVERAAEGCQQCGGGAVLRAHFPHDRLDQLGLVGWEGGERLRALRVLNLWRLEGTKAREVGSLTSFVPRSPYMLREAVVWMAGGAERGIGGVTRWKLELGRRCEWGFEMHREVTSAAADVKLHPGPLFGFSAASFVVFGAATAHRCFSDHLRDDLSRSGAFFSLKIPFPGSLSHHVPASLPPPSLSKAWPRLDSSAPATTRRFQGIMQPALRGVGTRRS